ncbi:hypothetical protein N7495_003257 [Penicillium taxi]|uniref:uncharacterized protein n=1 Tax=Penicillium taxi TaxID=168475 RepID=UPI0025457F13|nr:uncharacterized protein N7495_003257 [Penicillium taxi]KAJ5902729.1 hypothetical protein N7495_003257 [Penicillium taxi]
MSDLPHQDSKDAIYLHAELLPNIRQITLYVSLPHYPKLHGIHPEIRLSDSRTEVTVSLPEPFHNVTGTIILPARVGSESGRIQNISPVSASKINHDYSVRMQIDANLQTLTSQDELVDDYVPWTAADMSTRTRIQCRMCGNRFLKPQPEHTSENDQSPAAGWIWKDLPSGNWAEMMDFWHCHKPDPHEEDSKSDATAALGIEGQNAQIKGYGASSRLEAIAGTVLIDVATFLIAYSDCVGLKKDSQLATKSVSKPSEQLALHCDKCDAIVGMDDSSMNGYRLLKANLSLNADKATTHETQWESHPTEIIVAAQLLELIERESARRFVVHCGQKSGLLLWVFNPDMRYSHYSSSTTRRVNARQAMKVFFQQATDVESILNRDIGKPSPLSVEELELPRMIYEALSRALLNSHMLLPLSVRRFNEWQVGLLSRFSREELGLNKDV